MERLEHDVDCKEILIRLEQQNTRMTSLENRFDSLLESLDTKMSKLIDVLAERSNSLPVNSVLLLIGAVMISVSMAFFGHEAVVAIINAIKK
jgi:hypothetical protein